MRTSFNFARGSWSTLYSDGQHTIVILYQVVFEVADLLLLLLLLFRLKAKNLFPLPASSPHLPDHYNYLSGFKNRRIVYTHGTTFVPHGAAAATALLKIPLLWAPRTLDIIV